MSTPPELYGQALGGESSVFFGNIPFQYNNEDLVRLQQTVGAIRSMKMMQREDN